MSRPDWADHNVHDPGWTLVQLFAFLRDQLLFRTPPGSADRRQFLVLAVAAAVGLLWWRRARDD